MPLQLHRVRRVQRLGVAHTVSHLLLLLLAVCTAAAADHAPASPKRGLIEIPQTPNGVFTGPASDLTWYYNYGNAPSPAVTSTNLQFVPMLWGASSADPGTGFADSVLAQLDAGANITCVLAFNEPDGCDSGGSCVDAQLAAQVWKSEFTRLQARGIKAGSPATVGSQGGLQWMQQWFQACDGGCKPDFLAVHWYGDFAGLASWMGQVNGTFGNHTTGGMWVTEFADAEVSLEASQSFYNTSTEYLDRLDFVGRYAYFGSFKSSVSNIGPNAAMLDQNGDLTDIGSWYLGGAATGNIPESGATRATASLLPVLFAVMFTLAALMGA